MIYIWLFVLLTAAITSVVLGKHEALYLVPGALLSFFMACFQAELWIQLLAFLAISVFLCFLLRFLFLGKRAKRPKSGKMDSIVGEKCTVTERIENFAGIGQVKVGEMYWAARALDDETVFEVGDTVTVLAVEGVKLIVR